LNLLFQQREHVARQSSASDKTAFR
jgi:hypothetical protein